nr:YceI family protein [uncultured Psychroserpens sp.]
MKKIKTALVLFTGLMLSFIGNAQDLKTQISVDFKIKNLGINVDGFFKSATITTNFNAKDISQWTLSGSVKVNSISTGNKKRDAHLLEVDYFDANTYPEIVIEANNFKKVSENNYDVTLNLTIKKTTKTITIPMQIIDNDSSLTLKTYFEINRRDYGVGGSSFVLSSIAKINVNHTLKKE